MAPFFMRGDYLRLTLRLPVSAEQRTVRRAAVNFAVNFTVR